MPQFKPIPGETPIDDVSGLIPKGVLTRGDLNKVEAVNIAKAMVKYLVGRLDEKAAPFDFVWLLQLRQEMFGDVWKWAGKLRTSATNIGVSPSQIETRLYDLTKNVPHWKDIPLIEQAALLHHESVFIHPFINGNGRWSRLLANIWLYRNGHPLTQWPDSSLNEESPIRAEYLAAIKAADNKDYNPLNVLHRRYTPTDFEHDTECENDPPRRRRG